MPLPGGDGGYSSNASMQPGGSVYQSQVPAAANNRAAATKPTPRPRTPSKPSNSGGGGGGYNPPVAARGSIGGNQGISSPAAKAPPPPPPEKPGPISESAWQAKDPTYLQAIADLAAAFNTAKTNSTAAISDAQNQQVNQLQDAENQRQQNLASMLQDYASRGLDTSTMYQTAQDQYNQQMNNQEDAIRQAIAARIAGYNADVTDAQNQQQSGTLAAQQAAAARYQSLLAQGLL